ncbi:MAG: Ig-like domain-containing protein [Treponema sp.]|nr:Ig-like domain-containing protein [Candidatus Treponema equifaecale]
MKLFKKIVTVFAASALLFGSMISCSNLSDNSESETTQTGYGRVVFTCAKTLSNINFTYAKDENSEFTTLGKWTDAESASRAGVMVPFGSWTFKLSAIYNEKEYAGTTTGEIKEGETTALKFTLRKVGGDDEPAEPVVVEYNFVGLSASDCGVSSLTESSPTALPTSSKTVKIANADVLCNGKNAIRIRADGNLKSTALNFNGGSDSDISKSVTISDLDRYVSFPVTGTGTVSVSYKIVSSASATKDSAQLGIFDSNGKVIGSIASELKMKTGDSEVKTLTVSVPSATVAYLVFSRNGAGAGGLDVYSITVTATVDEIPGTDPDDSSSQAEYTVSFDLNGGTGTAPVAKENLKSGSEIELPATTGFTKEKATCIGWATSKDAASGLSGKVTVSGNVTYYLVWTTKPTYTVTFKNGTEVLSTAKVVEGGKATAPNNPSKDCYTFKEWQLNGTAYNFDSPVNSDIELTAAWSEIAVASVTISGGTSVKIGSTLQLTATVLPANATNKNVTWNVSGTGATVSDSGLVTGSAEGSVTVTATCGGKNGTVTVRVVDPSKISPIEIIKAEGWLESSYVTWKPAEYDSYNVYVKATDGDYKKLDDQLIRSYAETAGSKTVSYWRADALGLKAGTYSMKVVGVNDGAEVAASADERTGIMVAAHDRSGFAFSSQSPVKSANGAYNADGTLRAGAKVIYITNENAKTVKATIDGAECTGFQGIVYAKQKRTSTEIVDIRIIGTIYAANMDSFGSSAEGLQVKGANARQNMNLTIEGVGEDAGIHGFGILIRNCANVELRNFAVMDCMDDSISVDTDNCNLWIHNLDLFYGQVGSDADQKKGDGTIDIKNSQFCTVSYNHYWDSGKASLLDASAQTSNWVDNITYHHNWFDHSDSRHPRVRNGYEFHIYNNYYDGNAKYGIGSACGASIFSEANYFRNCKYPMISGKQGTEEEERIKDKKDKGTLSGESGGIIKSYNDYMTGQSGFISYQSNNSSFDAYVVSSRDEVISETIKSASGRAYSNFETKATMYSYTADTPEAGKEKVIAYAGRVGGGDLRWTFASSEDTNYAVIPAFKTAVVEYKSKLVSIQGDGTGSGNNDGDGNNGGDTTPPTPGVPAITLAASATSVAVGGNVTITVTPTNFSGTPTYAFSSSSNGIATVNESGVVNGVAAGSVTITVTATYGSESATKTIDLTVKEKSSTVVAAGSYGFKTSGTTEGIANNNIFGTKGVSALAGASAMGFEVTCQINSTGLVLKSPESSYGSVVFTIASGMKLTFINTKTNGVTISTEDGYIENAGTKSKTLVSAENLVLGAGTYKIVGATGSSAQIECMTFVAN